MFIYNFTELLNNHKIDPSNYFICSTQLKKKLTKLGFSPIGFYDKKFVFVKDERLNFTLESLGEMEVEKGIENTG